MKESAKKAPKNLTHRQLIGQKVEETRATRKKVRAVRRRDRAAAIARGEEVEIPKPITTEDKRIGQEPQAKVDQEYQVDTNLEELRVTEETKIMLVSAEAHPGERAVNFMKELSYTLPHCHFFKRKSYSLKAVSGFAIKRGYTCLIVLQEKDGVPDSMYLMSLPDGPSSLFKISGLKLGSEIPGSASCNTLHKPEVVTSHFSTRLGLRVAKQLQSIFPAVGDDVGRRCVVFHNQRDFIFFRHFRYVFRNVTIKGEEDKELKQKQKPIADEEDWLEEGATLEEEVVAKDPACALKEIGPRFTLRLRSIQLTGKFDRAAEYEYQWRPDVNVNRATCEL